MAMIYTFLIKRPRTCRLAELRRIRMISIPADSENAARTLLVGLPLVFVSRTPDARVNV
ncbi:host cell division inhibitor Icd-like protein [Aeromonas veronii]|uniref:host cell division inhibitor Icd-like protein n=1 Tax=Aeromonas veronii TaxID=654 RepID=UPI001E32DF68|nr:host cell division inhibitor Icd-like protein [Aeromonas veronii]MCD6616749.1 host cell division inhibitor Icd-like protein [Aeromonas veronii]